METQPSTAGWTVTPYANESANWTGNCTTAAPEGRSDAVTIAASCSLIALSLVSLAVNVVLLCSFYLIRTMRPYLILNRSLVAADTFSLFFFALGLFIFTLLPVFEISPDAPCTFLLIEGLRMSGILTTLCHLGAVAAFHYSGTKLPLLAHVHMTNRKARFCTVLLWTIPSSLLLSYMFVLEGDGFDKCPFEFILFLKFRMVFCIPFFTILGMMIIVYVHMYTAVSGQRMPGVNIDLSVKKYLKTSLMILGTTLVGWVPAFAYFALVCTDCPLRSYYRRNTVNDFIFIYTINFLLILKTATNCIIYAMRVKEIEQPLRKMGCGFLLRWCGIGNRTRRNDGDRTRASMKSCSRASMKSSSTSISRKQASVRLHSSVEVQMDAVGEVNHDRSYRRFKQQKPTTTSV